MTLPTSWVVFNSDGSSMSISKLVSQGSGKAATIAMSVVVDMDMQWCIHRPLHVPMCSLLSGMPILLNSVDSVFTILNFLDNTKFCAGNDDKVLVAVWCQQMLSLHGCSGNCDSSGQSNLYGFFPGVRALIGVDWLHVFPIPLYIISGVRNLRLCSRCSRGHSRYSACM